jgi:hypothetical protein
MFLFWSWVVQMMSKLFFQSKGKESNIYDEDKTKTKDQDKRPRQGQDNNTYLVVSSKSQQRWILCSYPDKGSEFRYHPLTCADRRT